MSKKVETKNLESHSREQTNNIVAYIITFKVISQNHFLKTGLASALALTTKKLTFT